MNTRVKAAIFIGSGLVAGFGAGYLFGRRAAYKKAGQDVDKFIEEQSTNIEQYKKELAEEYRDSIARETKTGAYTTIEGAADAIFNGGAVETEEEGGRHAALPDETNGSTDPEYAEGTISPDYPEGQSTAEDLEDNGVDVKGLIEKLKNQPVSDIRGGGVTYPGQDDEPAENSDDSDDEPISSVPGFVTVRDPERPYLISIDEYMEHDTPFSKVEMTYFEGDGVLVDTNEAIVPNVEAVVGLHNLDKWGQGTTDPEQVYIRNERLEIDIELTRDDNTYTRSVLNIVPSDEAERSMRKPLKMRSEDDGS